MAYVRNMQESTQQTYFQEKALTYIKRLESEYMFLIKVKCLRCVMTFFDDS